MATKPKSKVSNKKMEKHPKLKTKSKVAPQSIKKVTKVSKKIKPPKVSVKPSTIKSKTVKVKQPSKTKAPVKSVSKSTSKAIPPVTLPKVKSAPEPVKTMPKMQPKVNIENKNIVNKTTTIKTVTPPTTNGKTRYSDTELAEFKKIIVDKLTIARQELNYLQEQIVEMNENNADIQGSDWFDDSSIHAEVELLNNMAIRQRQFIQNLEMAMIRIENKTYGICMVNGTLIDKKRLLLVPHATKSIEAKEVERATMVPEINQVAPDDRVLRRSVEGKVAKKGAAKKGKAKSTKEYDDDEGDDMIEAPIEEMDGSFEGGED